MTESFQVNNDLVWGITRVVHEANRAFRAVLGQAPGPDWATMSEGDRIAAMKGVEKVLQTPGITQEELHETWVETKTAQGWVHGPVKDPDKKTHPCLVPYAQLPTHERTKDRLFRAIVIALSTDNELPHEDIMEGYRQAALLREPRDAR